MLNLFSNKQIRFNVKPVIYNVIKKNTEWLFNSETNIGANSIYFPLPSIQWFTNIYSFNKSYIKGLISYDAILNKLVKSYSNMLEYRIKILFKRRRDNKIRYSANKAYVSRAELNHTNTNTSVKMNLFNKYKLFVERYMWNVITLQNYKKKTPNHKNRLLHSLKNNYITYKKWNMVILRSGAPIELFMGSIKNVRRVVHITWDRFISFNKNFKYISTFFTSTNKIHFNNFKFNGLHTNSNELGLNSLIEKFYKKNTSMNLVELKSIALNSDVFSSAVALKLRDRKNKAVRILRKAILQMVRIPDLHTLITFDDNIEAMDKDNIIKTIKQQIVSGVRFEASGRLTRRLTAMRAVFKYRYAGSLKNIRSSFNNTPSTMLRGYVKSNSQYTLINSKTRNGTFGLKGWVSSHNFMLERIYLLLKVVCLQLVGGKAILNYLRILKDICAPGLGWALHNPPKPHAFTSLPLQSNIFLTIIKSVKVRLILDTKRLILNVVLKKMLAIINNYKKNAKFNGLIIKITSLIIKICNIYTLFIKITDVFVSITITIAKTRYPLVYDIFMVLHYEYVQIVTGNLHSKHIYMFLFLGFYIDNVDYLYWVIVMALCPKVERYVSNYLSPNHYLSRFIVYLIKIVYVLSLTMCVNSILTSIILPIYSKIIISLKEMFEGILKMAGNDKNNPNTGGPGNNNPTPNPNPNPKSDYTIGSSKSESNKKKKDLEKDYTYEQNYDNFLRAVDNITEYKAYNNRTFNMPRILENYREYLSTQDKIDLNDLLNKKSHKVRWSEKTTVKEYWEKMLEVQKVNFKQKEDIINIFYKNSKMIQTQHLGGKGNYKSKEFKKELKIFHDRALQDYSVKKSIVLEQIKRKDGFEEQLRFAGSSAHKTFTDVLKKED
jgi:hypothetical protein